MQVSSTNESEVRLTLEAVAAMVNGLDDDEFDLRAALVARGFSRAGAASAASVDRLHDRIADLADLVRSLPGATVDDAARRVNEELTELAIAPHVTDHDEVGPHIHWTAPTATFDSQVVTDVLMSLALELCDNGTERFGRCGAEGCDDLFYDTTRNRSRRFCDDPRCASRTHTADHRARRRR